MSALQFYRRQTERDPDMDPEPWNRAATVVTGQPGQPSPPGPSSAKTLLAFPGADPAQPAPSAWVGAEGRGTLGPGRAA